MIYQHARISTGGQSAEAQVRRLRAAGAAKYSPKWQAGPRSSRRWLRRSLAQLPAGDVLMVTRLDGLARSTRDLLNTPRRSTERKAGFRSLGDTWANTTTAHGCLTLPNLGGLAAFKRELNPRPHRRWQEPRQSFEGSIWADPLPLTPEQRKEAIQRRSKGASLQELADSYDRSISTMRHATRDA